MLLSECKYIALRNTIGWPIRAWRSGINDRILSFIKVFDFSGRHETPPFIHETGFFVWIVRNLTFPILSGLILQLFCF